jgi:archaemetzincin
MRNLLLTALVLGGCLEPAPVHGKPGHPAPDTAVGRPAKATVDPFAFDPTLFARMARAQPGDWLSDHPEPGQTFFQYVMGVPVRRTPSRGTIVIQPIGPFSGRESALLDQLVDLTTAFFQIPVRRAPPIPLPSKGMRTRDDLFTGVQYRTTVIERDVLLPRLPADALCYLGVTMADLYPAPSWNYVFGEATYKARVGIFSLARYSAHFWGRPETPKSERLLLLRAFKVLTHEATHMLSVAHCTAYQCLMNGSNSLDELDREPEWLCPVCLKKLQWNLGLDVLAHYQQLRARFERAGLASSVGWASRRLAQLGTAPESQ